MAPNGRSKDKENLITMVGLHMRWLDVLEEVGPMLELVEVDRGMGTWGKDTR